jgi:hypothetical protein
MTDISAAVAAALGKIVDSGKIEAAIDNEIQKTIAEVIHNQLRPYSDFGKALEAKLKAALDIERLNTIGVGGYNAIVLELLQRKIGPMIHTLGATQIDETLTKLLAPAPAEKKLSELVEEFKENIREDYTLPKDRGSEITVEVEQLQYGRVVALDRRPSRSRHSCELCFHVRQDGHIHHLRYLPRAYDQSCHHVFIGEYYGFERTLFQLHACRTKLVMDVNAVDRSMSWGEECHCDD